MPRFYYVKGEDGQSRMVEAPYEELAQVPVVEPNGPTLETGARRGRWHCTACNPPKAFAQAGILSMHFAKQHPDLKKDKDSWRKYATQEAVHDGTGAS